MVRDTEAWGRQLARRVAEELRMRIAEGVPRGELLKRQTEVAAAIGKKRPYFEKMTRRTGGGKVEIGALCDILAYLRINPGDFFADVFGEPAELPGRPYGEIPEAAQAAVDLSQRSHQIARPLVIEDLSMIDANRYDNPNAAVDAAERAVERTPPELLPKLLGILASCYRMTLALDQAEHTVRAGLSVASPSDFSLRGELLQRLGFILAERGEFKVALRITERAIASYVTENDSAGVGRCLVDRGVYFFHLSRFPGGIRAYEAALEQLPETEILHRYASYQGLGLIHQRLGHIKPAGAFAQRAGELVDSVGKANAIRHTWLLSSIEKERGDLCAAERHIRNVVDFFSPEDTHDAVVAILDLVQILLLQRRREEAGTEALKLIPLLKETKSRPLKSEVWKFIRSGRSQLDVERIKEIRAVMKRVQGTRPRPG